MMLAMCGKRNILWRIASFALMFVWHVSDCVYGTSLCYSRSDSSCRKLLQGPRTNGHKLFEVGLSSAKAHVSSSFTPPSPSEIVTKPCRRYLALVLDAQIVA
jgi:hypothetical protein